LAQKIRKIRKDIFNITFVYFNQLDLMEVKRRLFWGEKTDISHFTFNL